MKLTSFHLFSLLIRQPVVSLLHGGKSVVFVPKGLGFESWPVLIFFSVSGKIKKNSEKNELLVFRLFAQVLSANLTQRILCCRKCSMELKVQVLFILISEGLERFKKIFKKFFFSIQLVSAQRLWA